MAQLKIGSVREAPSPSVESKFEAVSLTGDRTADTARRERLDVDRGAELEAAVLPELHVVGEEDDLLGNLPHALSQIGSVNPAWTISDDEDGRA